MKRLTENYEEYISHFPEELRGENKSYPFNSCVIYERLGAYEDLEEQGLLLRLPCKNWMEIVFGEQEVFWGIDTDYIENPIRKINVDSSERFTWYDGWKTVVIKGADENGLDWEFFPAEIGKTVFLTYEEAKAAHGR